MGKMEGDQTQEIEIQLFDASGGWLVGHQTDATIVVGDMDHANRHAWGVGNETVLGVSDLVTVAKLERDGALQHDGVAVGGNSFR